MAVLLLSALVGDLHVTFSRPKPPSLTSHWHQEARHGRGATGFRERPLHIKQLDHLVLTVENIDKTVHFYVSVLGMQKEVFGRGRVALKFGSPKINLHEAGKEVEPKAHNPTPGSADLCFITDTDLNLVMEHVTNMDVEIIEGPVSLAQ